MCHDPDVDRDQTTGTVSKPATEIRSCRHIAQASRCPRPAGMAGCHAHLTPPQPAGTGGTRPGPGGLPERRGHGAAGRAVVPSRRPHGRHLQDRGGRQPGPAAWRARFCQPDGQVHHRPPRPVRAACGDGTRRSGTGGPSTGAPTGSGRSTACRRAARPDGGTDACYLRIARTIVTPPGARLPPGAENVLGSWWTTQSGPVDHGTWVRPLPLDRRTSDQGRGRRLPRSPRDEAGVRWVAWTSERSRRAPRAWSRTRIAMPGG